MKIITCHQNYGTQTFASSSDTWNALCYSVNNFFSVHSTSTREGALLQIFRVLVHWTRLRHWLR